MSHTSEPWSTRPSAIGPSMPIVTGTGNDSIALCNSPENARRILACVNACEGISNAHLEAFSRSGVDFITIEQPRDELLAAVKAARDMVGEWGGYASQYFQEKWDLAGDIAKLDSAIAKAEL